MGLEQILDKLILPVKALDGTLKLGHDFIAAGASKAGIDRFSLASYVAIGGGTVSIAAGIGDVLNIRDLHAENISSAAPLGLLGGLTTLFLSCAASQFREYFSGNLGGSRMIEVEEKLRLSRVARLVYLGIGGMFPLFDASNVFVSGSNGLWYTAGFSCASSFLYFIDGDHALWDKAKGLVGGAYHRLVPHLSPQPAPQPGTN